jgi:hypothetical protein
MMTDYTRIIDQIIPSGHPGSTLVDSTACLVLNEETRALVPDNEFNTVIGATNDINTNIITIKIPESIEGHNLSTCDYKILKWANTSSKQKGVSNLVLEGTNTFKWVPPPEAMTASGNLKISLTFYDEDDFGKITYRFNSLPYSGLSIGQGMDEIGINPISEDEIITVDLSSRNIIVPSSLNREIGKIGEQNLNTLKFRCNRYFQDKDFWGAGINILH